MGTMRPSWAIAPYFALPSSTCIFYSGTPLFAHHHKTGPGILLVGWLEIKFLSLLDMPDKDLASTIAGGDRAPVRSDTDADEGRSVTMKDKTFLTRRDVPKSDGPIDAGGSDYLAVWHEG